MKTGNRTADRDGRGNKPAPLTEERPWGRFTVLEEGDRYKVKRLEVMPGHRLSLQMHHHRSEHWVVVQGTAKVTTGDRTYLVHARESTYIPVATRHRVENPGRIPLVIIEVQNGDYLSEDDIVRFEDDYHRVEKPGSERRGAGKGRRKGG